MQIIYFTTSLHENDYPDFQKAWKVSLNPSNQNFHNKLIRALGKIASIEVFSLRPFSKSRCRINRLRAKEKKNGSICYHYLKVPINPFLRGFSFLAQSKKIIKDSKDLNLDDAIILTDTINPRAMKVANAIGKKYSIPVIGICTDSPSNITGTRRSYTVNLLNQSKNLDGYIALTKSLGELFNPHNKPSFIFEGLVEDTPVINQFPKRSYFFFGGALLPRYGINELIGAFKKLPNPDVELIICGHHFNLKDIHERIKDDKRISFLGVMPVEDVLHFESGAIANINPRPFSEDLDRFSVPSKTLEYLYSGRPTISVRNTILQQHFSDEAIWSKTSNEKDLLNCMEKVLAMSQEERQTLGKNAQKKVINLYSLTSISEKIKAFLTGFSN